MFDFLKKEPPRVPEGVVRRHYLIYGSVQGVGFRYRAMYAAQSLGLTGWVRNLSDGSVEMEVQGKPETIRQIFPLIRRSDWVDIRDMKMTEIQPDPYERRFLVRDGY